MAASSAFGCEAASVHATRSPHGDGRTQVGVKPSQNRIAISIARSIARCRDRLRSADSTPQRVEIGRMAKDALSLV